MKRVLLILAACSILSCEGTKEPIRLGVVLPLTADFRVYGEQGVLGAQLAVAEINAKGGVLDGRLLELVIRDNKTRPAESVRLSRELIQIDDVFALLGPVSSIARDAMLEVSETYRVPMFYGLEYEGGRYSRYLFTYSAIPDQSIAPLIPYLTKHIGNQFYIYGYDYVWPHKVTDAIRSSVTQAGGKIRGIEFTPFGVQNYSEVFKRIERSEAQNLILLLPGQDGFRFLTQLADYPFQKPIKVTAIAADESYIAAVPGNRLDGVLTIQHFFSNHQSEQTDPFVRNFVQNHRSGKQPGYTAKAHYDLIYLLAAAIEKAGEADRERVIDLLPGISRYEGEEQVTIRDDHHLNLPMYLGEFQSGELNVIHRFGVIEPQDQRREVAEP